MILCTCIVRMSERINKSYEERRIMVALHCKNKLQHAVDIKDTIGHITCFILNRLASEYHRLADLW